MTIKSLLLSWIARNPAVSIPASILERWTSTLQKFVSGARFDDSILRANDSSYTRISIIMPSYNDAHFIERSILSVLNQNYPNLQFIIMDGGSTDGTIDVIRKYEKHLSWRSEPDRGQSDALNKALMLADGELVGWQNSDDVYFPGAFQRMHELSRRRPLAVLYSGSVAQINLRDRVVHVPIHIRATVWRLLYGGYVVSSQGVFLRRPGQSRAEWYDSDLYSGMDLDLWLKLLTHGRAEFIPELCGGFRVHEGTKTSSTPGRGHAEVTAIRKRYGIDDASASWRLKRNLLFLSELLQWAFVIKRRCTMIGGEGSERHPVSPALHD